MQIAACLNLPAQRFSSSLVAEFAPAFVVLRRPTGHAGQSHRLRDKACASAIRALRPLRRSDSTERPGGFRATGRRANRPVSSCIAIGCGQKGRISGQVSAMPPRARIFIVDDHPLVREWLAGLLRQQSDFDVCGQAEDAFSQRPGGAWPRIAAGRGDRRPVAQGGLGARFDQGPEGLRHHPDRRSSCSPRTRRFTARRAVVCAPAPSATSPSANPPPASSRPSARCGPAASMPDAELLARLAERFVGRGAAPGAGSDGGPQRPGGRGLSPPGPGPEPTRKIATELNPLSASRRSRAYCARIKEKLGISRPARELMREAVRWVESESRGEAEGPAKPVRKK